MERKILFGIMLISVVALFIGGGTYAYFSDTEIAENNTFTA
ncbi:MAG: M73 family metallopeptidase [Methanococcoides sp.]|nr:M73 family metallopeptidase [Methanococcoides sp.]